VLNTGNYTVVEQREAGFNDQNRMLIKATSRKLPQI